MVRAAQVCRFHKRGGNSSRKDLSRVEEKKKQTALMDEISNFTCTHYIYGDIF